MTTLLNVFRFSFQRSRWMLTGWGIPLFLLGAITMPFYDLVAENAELLLALLENLPPSMTAFIGGERAAEFLTPPGFIALRYFAFMPISLGAYGALVGSGLLAADEERGVLDFVLAHPAGRAAVFWGRYASLAAGAGVLMVGAWLGLGLGVLRAEALQFPMSQLALPFVSAYALTMFFATLALALSMVMPSRVAAAMATGIIVFASYVATSLARAIPDLKPWAAASPVSYFQEDAMLGLDPAKLAVLVIPTLLLGVLAWLGFRGRDIRVAGDSGWKLPLLKRGR